MQKEVDDSDLQKLFALGGHRQTSSAFSHVRNWVLRQRNRYMFLKNNWKHKFLYIHLTKEDAARLPHISIRLSNSRPGWISLTLPKKQQHVYVSQITPNAMILYKKKEITLTQFCNVLQSTRTTM